MNLLLILMSIITVWILAMIEGLIDATFYSNKKNTKYRKIEHTLSWWIRIIYVVGILMFMLHKFNFFDVQHPLIHYVLLVVLVGLYGLQIPFFLDGMFMYYSNHRTFKTLSKQQLPYENLWGGWLANVPISVNKTQNWSNVSRILGLVFGFITTFFVYDSFIIKIFNN